MITYETWSEIQRLAAQKVQPSQIATNLQLDVKAVQRWIGCRYVAHRKVQRISKLAPFKEKIIEYMSARPLNAQQIHQLLRKDGFDGGLTIVKDFLRTICTSPRKAFEAHKWMLAVLQKEISDKELANEMSGLKDIKALVEKLSSDRISDQKKSLSILAANFGIRGETICKALGISSSTHNEYRKAFVNGGAQALYAKRRGVKHKSDDESLKAAVFRLLHEPPSNYGINRTSWTMPLLAKVLAENGNSACPAVIRTIIRSAGYRWRKARVVLTSSDPNYSEKLAHVRSILSNLQSDEAFFSIDEYGPFAVRMRGGLKLSAVGEQPIIPQWQKSRGSLILTAALELSSNQVTHFYSAAKNTDEMIRMMNILVAKYRGLRKLYLSWDAASWHIAKRLCAVIDEHNSTVTASGGNGVLVETAPLPSGAQFLNVIESVFSGMSRAVIHNSDYPTIDDARVAIDRYLDERNQIYLEHPQRAGKKIWGKEREPAMFSESNNCKDPRYR